MTNLARYAIRYALPDYTELFNAKDEANPNIKREVSRCVLFVESRGDGLWRVVDEFRNSSDLGGNMSFEPSPSNVGQDYLDSHRFTLEEAFRVVARALPAHVAIFTGSAHQQIQLAKEKVPNSEPLVAYYERVIELVEQGVEQVRGEFLAGEAATVSDGNS